MHTLRKTVAFAVLFFLGTTVFAQGKIEFIKTEHDFGNIKEDGGPADVVFTFKNTGNAPIKLTQVKASCGCTTPTWTKTEVKPGEQGTVKASYNPLNRPGAFNKTVTVTTDTEPSTVFLRIKGSVNARSKGAKDWYPYDAGNLLFRSIHMSFGDVFKDGTDTVSTVAYNQGTKPVTLFPEKSTLPAHIKMSVDKKVLQPKETAKITITIDGAKKSDWGYVYDYLNLVTDDAPETNKRLNVSASLRENFGAWKKGDPAPKASFDKGTHNFGTVEQNSRVNTAFTITNKGEKNLILRKTKASCGCTATQPKKTVLLPGESTTIDVTYSSGTQKGKQRKSVTIITNDPERQDNTLYIEADVAPKSDKPKEETVDLRQKTISPIREDKKPIVAKVIKEKTQPVITETTKVVTEKVAETVKTVSEIKPEPKAETAVKIADYKVGERVYMTKSFGKKKALTVIGFVENVNGNKIQVRIADCGGKKKLNYDGIKLMTNSVIWDDFSNWKLSRQ